MADQIGSMGGLPGMNPAALNKSQPAQLRQPSSTVEPYTLERQAQDTGSKTPEDQFGAMMQANGFVAGFSAHSATGSGTGSTTSTSFSGGQEIVTTITGAPNFADMMAQMNAQRGKT